MNIIVTDFFGKTSALMNLAQALNIDIIVDPYAGVNMNFDDENEAYNYFVENVGLNNYLEILSKTIQHYECECKLVGFSIGASIIWQLSQLPSTKISTVVKQSICYYGSQIRHMNQGVPSFEVQLVFPKSECHFDVSSLHQKLATISRVTSTQVNFLHGFMNIHSDNYNQLGYQDNITSIHHELNRIR
jgi:dienelactone hydrolase